ncbi:CCHC-type domain-containing protein [Trichonephila inaurata madagascariensis]|uniref:CCHC-type domain-containing protein n=1 Tax=Trichonephila inaurata madagascariensis TaxID=2747483 RepID=A0A8X6YI54_9ARAC|nr:CCHC-type domain-containing protein [Trichonephila inaurata madagascariensis]
MQYYAGGLSICEEMDISQLWRLVFCSEESCIPKESKEELRQTSIEHLRNVKFEERFLVSLPWLDSHLPLPDNFTLAFKAHCRVVFGISSSPFLLGSTIQYHLEKKLEEAKRGHGKYPECIAQKLMRSFYVDNCLASVQTQSELDRFIDVATEIMAERKFKRVGAL